MMYKHQTVGYNLYSAATTARNRAEKKATIPLPTLRTYRGGVTQKYFTIFHQGSF